VTRRGRSAGVAARRSRANPIDRGGGRAAWGFLAPFGLFYLVFVLGPLAFQLVSSFFATSLVRPGIGSAIGLGNYVEVLTSSNFWIAAWVSEPMVPVGFNWP